MENDSRLKDCDAEFLSRCICESISPSTREDSYDDVQNVHYDCPYLRLPFYHHFQERMNRMKQLWIQGLEQSDDRHERDISSIQIQRER